MKGACMLNHFSHVWFFGTHGLWPARLFCPWDSPGKNTGVGCYSLLQEVFPAQGSNPCLLQLLHRRWILYCWATGETCEIYRYRYKYYIPVSLYIVRFISSLLKKKHAFTLIPSISIQTSDDSNLCHFHTCNFLFTVKKSDSQPLWCIDIYSFAPSYWALKEGTNPPAVNNKPT